MVALATIGNLSENQGDRLDNLHNYPFSIINYPSPTAVIDTTSTPIATPAAYSLGSNRDWSTLECDQGGTAACCDG